MAVDSSTYGGGLAGPSIRSGSTLKNIDARDRARTPARPINAPAGTGGSAPRPNTIVGSKPKTAAKAKPKKKKVSSLTTLGNKFDKALKTPVLDVPTLVMPDLEPIPDLDFADLEDYVVAPIDIGAVPTLEDIPDQQPVVALDDRQSSAMRRRRQQEIAKIKARRGVGATLLSGGGAGGAVMQARGQLGDPRQVLTRKGV